VVTLGEIFEFSAPPQTFPAPIITFLDLEKAFDSIAHSTIARTLRHIRASESFSRLILDVLWGTSRINVNGHLSPSLTRIRGTRQDDPIAPTLFAIGVDCLNRAFLSELRDWSGILPCHRNKVLMCADDIVLCTSSRQELDMALSLLEQFAQSTSLAVSRTKSCCLPVHWDATNVSLSFSLITKEAPEKYWSYTIEPEDLESSARRIISRIILLLRRLKPMYSPILAKVIILRSYALPVLTHYLYFETKPSSLRRPRQSDSMVPLWSSNPEPTRSPHICP